MVFYNYTELHEIHARFRGFELTLPFLNIHFCFTLEVLETLLREMEFDPRTNELEKYQ